MLLLTGKKKAAEALKKSEKEGTKDVNENQLSTAEQSSRTERPVLKGSYSIWKGVLRLGFAIYLSNYYYIRTDYFTERGLLQNTLYNYVSWLIKQIRGDMIILIAVNSLPFPVEAHYFKLLLHLHLGISLSRSLSCTFQQLTQ